MVPARHRSGYEKGRPGEKAAPLSIVRVPHPGQPYRYSIPTGAVLIRPAKTLIGAESVQERPTDARGAGRPGHYPDWRNGHQMAAPAPQIAP